MMGRIGLKDKSKLGQVERKGESKLSIKNKGSTRTPLWMGNYEVDYRKKRIKIDPMG